MTATGDNTYKTCRRHLLFKGLNNWTLPHLEFALSEQCAKLSDALCCDGIALRPVLGHLILQSDEAYGGALLFLQAKELQNALVIIDVAVDKNEQDLDRQDETINVRFGVKMFQN